MWPALFATPFGFVVLIVLGALNAGLLPARAGRIIGTLFSILLIVYLPFIGFFYAMGHAFNPSEAPQMSSDQFGSEKAIKWGVAFMAAIWVPIWVRSRFDRRQPRYSEPDERSGGFPVSPVERESWPEDDNREA